MSKTLRERVMDEADLCRNDGADDIARLLDEVAAALADQAQAEPVGRLVADLYDGHVFHPRIPDDWSMLGKDLYTAPQPAAQPVAVPETLQLDRALAFVPDGYALVPVEPTREMRKAATIEQEHHRRMSLSLFGDEPAAVIYRAMLSAAPKLQQ